MPPFKEKPMTEEAPMYLYATEMVSTYYSLLGVKGKHVLTICGSGDQVLNAYFFGVTSVVGIDLNKRAEFITRLKMSAVMELTYKEFLQFFSNKRSRFAYRLYQKIKKNLNKETADFFDNLYFAHSFNGSSLARSPDYFRQRDHFATGRIKTMNAYLGFTAK